MWYNVTSKLPEPKYNPIYNKDYIPDFDAPLEERGFRVPPPPVPRPDTPWQRFIDEHGERYFTGKLSDGIVVPIYTEADRDYSSYTLELESLSYGTYQGHLQTFNNIEDQADKISWLLFNSEKPLKELEQLGLPKEELLSIVQGNGFTQPKYVTILSNFLEITPTSVHYKENTCTSQQPTVVSPFGWVGQSGVN